MATTSRKDYDAELSEWLGMVQGEQTDAVLDAYADLWLANDDAAAIKDVRCPAYAAAHERIDAALAALGY